MNPQNIAYIRCPHCGDMHPITTKFCTKTGKTISESSPMDHCPKCYSEIMPNWKNCVNCGYILSPSKTDDTITSTSTLSFSHKKKSAGKFFWYIVAAIGLLFILYGGFGLLKENIWQKQKPFVRFLSSENDNIASDDSKTTNKTAQSVGISASEITKTKQSTLTKTPQPTDTIIPPQITDTPIGKTNSSNSNNAPSMQEEISTKFVSISGIDFYKDFDFAFISDKGGQFQVYLSSSNDLSNTQKIPLPDGYQSSWFPTFCETGIGMEVHSNKLTVAKWIYIYYPDDNFFYRWEDPPPYTALAIPRCSANGDYIAYSAYLNDEYFLQVAKLANEKLLFELETTYSDASESYTSGYASFPIEGKTFISMANLNRSQFYTMLLTTDFKQTDSIGLGKYPAFSPDGTQIAYLCNQENFLCISSLKGEPLELIRLRSNLVGGNTMPMGTPWWSQDGNWIYYSSSDGGDWDIFRIHPDGSNNENLTIDWPSNELSPTLRW